MRPFLTKAIRNPIKYLSIAAVFSANNKDLKYEKLPSANKEARKNEG